MRRENRRTDLYQRGCPQVDGMWRFHVGVRRIMRANGVLLTESKFPIL